MADLKNTTVKQISRRNFLGKISSAAAVAAIPVLYYRGNSVIRRNKMAISFYMDDTGPARVKAEAYREFINYCQAGGIRGESSVILGQGGKSMATDPDENQRLYLSFVRESYEKGIDSHMEIMTHGELFNFGTGRKNEGGIHEGLWLHEPGVSAAEYERYFAGIIAEGEKAGIKFTGLTWPGCSCDACTKRYAELKAAGPLHINNAAFEALLNLAEKGKFRGRVLPVFYESSETEFGIFRKKTNGKFGIYDLMPNAKDNFGIWENSADHVNPDYYISDDGKSGIIIRHLENNTPYCMWYMHWQGVNPGNGKGWQAFKTVTGRIRKHLSDKVKWMHPGEIVTAYHDAGGWGFLDKI
jgi:hypothetical protein